MAQRWGNGSGSVELLGGGVVGGLAWLAMVERATVTFAGEVERRRWDLRVTEVFRETPSGWERVHRHADPLVDRQDLGELADLLGRRG